MKKLILLPLIYICFCLCLFIPVKAQDESDEAKKYRASGMAALGGMRTDEAIDYFSKAIDLEPNYIRVYYTRGLAYWLKIEEIYETRGQGYRGTEIVDKAIKDYRKAIELKLNSADAYIALAALYVEKRDTQKARETLDELSKLNLDKSVIYNNRALLYASLGEFEKALKDYETSISLKEYSTHIPKGRTYASRAQLHAAMGNYDAAIADYSKQLEIGGNYFAQSLRAWTYYLKGDFRLAIADINLAVKKYPKAALPYATRGTIYLRSEKYAQALADYSKAIELTPKNADYYRARASVYRKLEQTDLAEADEAKALEFEKPDAEPTTEN